MKKNLYRLLTFTLFMIIWYIMNDGLIGINTVIGAFVSIISIIISNKLLDFNYIEVFSIPPLKFIKYLLFMIFEIYKSGFIATYMIITGNINPHFVRAKIHKDIKDPYLRNIVASSITLTPGTITVDNKEDTLVVLCLHRAANAPSPTASFEPLVLEIQQRKNEGSL